LQVAKNLPRNKTQVIAYRSELLLASGWWCLLPKYLIQGTADSLYSGISMGVNSKFRLNIAETLPQAATAYFWLCYDAVIEMDLLIVQFL
jgi:hypothetical protein